MYIHTYVHPHMQKRTKKERCTLKYLYCMNGHHICTQIYCVFLTDSKHVYVSFSTYVIYHLYACRCRSTLPGRLSIIHILSVHMHVRRIKWESGKLNAGDVARTTLCIPAVKTIYMCFFNSNLHVCVCLIQPAYPSMQNSLQICYCYLTTTPRARWPYVRVIHISCSHLYIHISFIYSWDITSSICAYKYTWILYSSYSDTSSPLLSLFPILGF